VNLAQMFKIFARKLFQRNNHHEISSAVELCESLHNLTTSLFVFRNPKLAPSLCVDASRLCTLYVGDPEQTEQLRRLPGLRSAKSPPSIFPILKVSKFRFNLSEVSDTDLFLLTSLVFFGDGRPVYSCNKCPY
jgi:hypothetical protein